MTAPAPRVEVSVVVPVYREQAGIGVFVERLSGVLADAGLASYELIFVDDGSPDGTWEAISALGKERPEVAGLRLSRNFGKEAALWAGLEAAEGRAVVVMDGDLQHPPALIPAMLAGWRRGADVVEATKRSRGEESLASRYGARLFYALLRKLAGQDLRGATDFKLLDRRVVDALIRMDERHVFFRGMTKWLGFRHEQVTFDVPGRATGATRWSTWRLVRLALNALTAFTAAPLHIVTLLGLVFLTLSVVLGTEALVLKFSGRALDGFTTVILLQLITGSAIMISLGVIGEYLARTFDEVKRRPRYIVMERTPGPREAGPERAREGVSGAAGGAAVGSGG